MSIAELLAEILQVSEDEAKLILDKHDVDASIQVFVSQSDTDYDSMLCHSARIMEMEIHEDPDSDDIVERTVLLLEDQ